MGKAQNLGGILEDAAKKKNTFSQNKIDFFQNSYYHIKHI